MAKSIEELRKERNITQIEMSKILDIPVSTYNMYEKGNRRVPRKIACHIAKVLKVKVEDIFLPSTFTISKNNDIETA